MKKDAMMLVGVALIAFNVYEVLKEPPPAGTGSDDDPIRMTTTSPLLALVGFVLILGGAT